MRKMLGLVVLVLGAAVALTACGGGSGGGSGGGGTMEVTLTTTGDDLKFSPSELKVKAGTAVTLTYNNQSRMEHDFTADLPTKEGKPVALKVAAGQSGKITFTPSKAGTYEAYCSVPGHKDGGMVAKVVVE